VADGSRRRAGPRAAARTPSLRDTVAFARAAHAGACAGGKPRWLRAVEVMRLLPEVLPGIRVTHEDRQVALLRDVLEATAATERDLLRAGFPEAVVEGVVRLSRFDAGLPVLDHLRAVAASRDLSAMRAAMAGLLLEEKLDPARPGGPAGAATRGAAEARERRRQAMAILARGLGC
jgi:(p)ppGpp synthase/HD superfamily hydrolase